MSADRLRQAAAVLREQVHATINHRWIVDGEGSGLPIVWADFDHDGGAQVADCLNDGDAAYIALMSPPVATELADLLSVAAAHFGTSTAMERTAALSVASAILGRRA
jgi:hypothetical protein